MHPNYTNPQHDSIQQAPAEQNSGGQPGTEQSAQGQLGPGQTSQGGSTTQSSPGSTTGPQQQLGQTGFNNTNTAPGQSAQPASATNTGSALAPGATATGIANTSGQTTSYTVPPKATFLGMPVDGIVVFTPLFLAGLLVFAWLSGRTPHTEQLTRLDKQRKRFDAREASKPESIDIFKNEKDDFLGRLLSQAGLEAQYDAMKTKWIGSAFGTTVVLFGLCIWQAPALLLLAIIIGPALGSFGFVQYIKWLAGERQKRMTQQLPQVLETMVSTLKAGSPVVECFKLLSETAPEPIRSEFRRGLVSMQLGKPFRDVLAEMGTRIRTADFRLLTQAIFISQDVGANLAEVVAVIAEAIRERFRLRDFLNSLTAQGKMTALFIGSLPYFITAMTFVMAQSYITPFLNHPIARIVFIALMIWEAIGAYILVKMTTFEV